MSQEQTLIDRGAECVAGDLILNRKVVGRYRNGQFILSAEGLDELENVVVAGESAAPASATRAPRKSKNPKNAEATDVEAKPAADVDALVSGLDGILGE